VTHTAYLQYLMINIVSYDSDELIQFRRNHSDRKAKVLPSFETLEKVFTQF
jgi:hypothetical protein